MVLFLVGYLCGELDSVPWKRCWVLFLLYTNENSFIFGIGMWSQFYTSCVFLVRNCKLCIRFSLACIDAVQSKKYVLKPLESGMIMFGDKTIKACKANEGKSFSILLPLKVLKARHCSCFSNSFSPSTRSGKRQAESQIVFSRHGYFTSYL